MIYDTDVRPLAGAGIEMLIDGLGNRRVLFAPSRGRELKYQAHRQDHHNQRVRPLAGAGIEIEKPKKDVKS